MSGLLRNRLKPSEKKTRFWVFRGGLEPIRSLMRPAFPLLGARIFERYPEQNQIINSMIPMPPIQAFRSEKVPKTILPVSLIASALIGASSIAHGGTAILDVEATLGGGTGTFVDLQSAAEGFTNGAVTGIWSNWSDSWGFGSQEANTGDGSANNGSGDRSDQGITVFGRSADDKGQTTTEIRVDYTGLTPNANYFLWAVVMQNTANAISHDLEWGQTSGALTLVASPESPNIGSPYEDSARIAGLVAGSQLAGFPLAQVTADGTGALTLYYDQGLDPGNNVNENRTQIDGVLFEEIVDPHCLAPWAPNGAVIANGGEAETIEIPVENIGATATLNISGASVIGVDEDMFAIDPAQFPLVLGVNAQGSLTVRFDPGTFAGELLLDHLEIVSDHGGTPGTVVTTPISGGVRNPWISTIASMDLGPIPSSPGTLGFEVDISNLGFSENLEITFAGPVSGDVDLFTVNTDFTTPLEILPGDSTTISLSFDSTGLGVGTYATNLEIDNNDNTFQTVLLTVVVADGSMELAITGYDAGTGMLSLTATNIPADSTFHLEQSTSLQSFGILSPVFDFDSTTAQPFLVPVDPATEPKLFLQAFGGASNP